MADAKCGAKTRKGGKCKAPAMSNGRCRVHGGPSTGAPKENSNATKHGIYSEHFTPEEHQYYNNTAIGNVEHELRLCRVRLRRALNAEQAAQGEPEIDEIVMRGNGIESDDPEMQKLHRTITAAYAPREEKRKVRDYVTIIDRLMARIESLEKTRAVLLAALKDCPETVDDMTRDDTVIAPDEQIPHAPIL